MPQAASQQGYRYQLTDTLTDTTQVTAVGCVGLQLQVGHTASRTAPRAWPAGPEGWTQRICKPAPSHCATTGVSRGAVAAPAGGMLPAAAAATATAAAA